MRLAPLLLLTAACASAQLKGIIDIHVHTDPDTVPRKVDAIDAARLARDAGMRGLLLKNHYTPTTQLAYAVNKAVGGIEMFASITLNLAVGGLNPEAIARAAQTRGGNLKLVWMPTYDAENQVRYSKEQRAHIVLARDGRLLPETIEALRAIAHYKLALATGHASGGEAVLLARAAREMGIDRVVITHPLYNVVNMNRQQMKEAVEAGAYLELCANQVLPTVPAEKRSDFAEYVSTIRIFGAEHCILSGDLGQPHHPVQTEGWKQFLAMLKHAGVTDVEIDIMARRNPARLLDLASPTAGRK